MGQEYSQPKASLIRPSMLHKLTASRFPCTVPVQIDGAVHSLSIPSSASTCGWLLSEVCALTRSDVCAVRTQKNYEMLDDWLLQLSLPVPPLSKTEALVPVLAQAVYGQVSQAHFSPVKTGRKKNTGTLYAVKIMQKAHLRKERRTRQAFSELSLLARLGCPYVVKMHWAFQTTANVYFVLDFCPGGELFFHLHHLGRFAEDQARFYFSEVLLAIEYLHTSGVIYRDLKPENVLLGLDGHVKIADFGLGKTGIFSGDTTHTFCGSPEYMCPEMLKGTGHGQPLDFYCLGALLYEMLTGLPPFFSSNRAKMFHSILHDPLPIPAYISPHARKLLLGLMEKDPSKRLGSIGGANEVRSADWLSGVPWDKLKRKQCQPPLIPNPQMSCFSHDYTSAKVDLSAFSATPPPAEDDFAGFEYAEEDESTVLETLSCTARNVPTSVTPALNLTKIVGSPRGSWLTEDLQPRDPPKPHCSSLLASPVTSRPASRERMRKQSQEPVRLIDMRASQFRPVVGPIMNLKIPAATVDLRPEKPPKPKPTKATASRLQLSTPHSLRRLSHCADPSHSGVARKVPMFTPTGLVRAHPSRRSPSQ